MCGRPLGAAEGGPVTWSVKRVGREGPRQAAGGGCGGLREVLVGCRRPGPADHPWGARREKGRSKSRSP